LIVFLTQVADDEKIDSLQLEYTYLLTSQLESQRLFFEEKLAVVEAEANEQLSAMELRCRSVVSEKNSLEEKLGEVEREKKTSEKKIQQLQQKITKLSTQLKEEKELNKCLSENQKLWKDRVTALEEKIDVTIKQKEKEMGDLQEQVRDLMFYLETQKKIAQSPEGARQELQEGQVVVSQQGASGTSTAGTTSTRKGRKKR
jgi:BRCA1-associated protein